MKVLIDYSNIVHTVIGVTEKRILAQPELDPLKELNVRIRGKIQAITREVAFLSDPSKNYEYILVEDRPPTRKRNLYSLYKQGRSGGSINSLETKIPLVEKGFPFCYAEGEEADDVIATIVGDGDEYIIVSGDRDIWSLKSESVHIMNPIKYKFIQVADVEMAFGIDRFSHIALIKTIWGDYGDSVPNCCPYLQRQLMPLVRQSDGTLSSFMELVKINWFTLSEKCRTLLLCSEDQLEINWELVRLFRDCEVIWN